MILHETITDRELFAMLRRGHFVLGGNKKLKIYGTLRCKSGKRMKRENRVFFSTEKEALGFGYRPCKNCLGKVSKKRIVNGDVRSEL
jgi:methylphosphotriester-DNA--protein-cysteine methyltransferase